MFNVQGMNSSMQEFVEAIHKTMPTSALLRLGCPGGRIKDGELVHTIQAKDITQVLAKYQSYKALQNSNVSQIFQQVVPIDVENTIAKYDKKVYGEDGAYEFYVDADYPRVCIYGNFNHAETTTMLNNMFDDDEITKIIISYGCGVRKLLLATEPEFPQFPDHGHWFSVNHVFYKRTRGHLVLERCNKEVALFVGIVFELCKDLQYDDEFESDFAREFDFPNYLDQLEVKKKL